MGGIQLFFCHLVLKGYVKGCIGEVLILLRGVCSTIRMFFYGWGVCHLQPLRLRGVSRVCSIIGCVCVHLRQCVLSKNVSPSASRTFLRRSRSAAACLSIDSVMILSGVTSVISEQ